MLEFKLLALLVIANGAPVIAQDLCKNRGAWPVDLGLRCADGRPLFGPSKTWRGLFSALSATTCSALLINLPWQVGLVVATAAMFGDLFSSFVKRRLNIEPSGQAVGVDQIPESLLPLLAVKDRLHLDWSTIWQLVALFFFLEISLSPLLYRLGIRRRPY